MQNNDKNKAISHKEYRDIFVRTGLSERESTVYEALLTHGKMRAQALLKLTPYTRTNLYNILDLLVSKGLVEEETESKVILFKPADPYKLATHIYDQKMRYAEADSLLNSVLPNLTELYKSTTEKPIVRFYSGEAGIKQVMDDSLTSKTEILSYIDPMNVDKYLEQANKSYIKQRNKLRINKKLLVEDNDFNRKRYKNNPVEFTEIRFMSYDLKFSNTVMQIYDNKISYMTIKPQSAIGVIVEDQFISKMHRALFDFNWQMAKGI